jgi:hypothetical protein
MRLTICWGSWRTQGRMGMRLASIRGLAAFYGACGTKCMCRSHFGLGMRPNLSSCRYRSSFAQVIPTWDCGVARAGISFKKIII